MQADQRRFRCVAHHKQMRLPERGLNFCGCRFNGYVLKKTLVPMLQSFLCGFVFENGIAQVEVYMVWLLGAGCS